LMEPGRRARIDLPGLEGHGATHSIAIGGTQRVQDVPSPVIMESDPREPQLQQRDHAALFEPSPHLIKGMMPIQNGAHQSCDSTPTGKPMRRMGRDEAVNSGGHLSTP